MNYNDEDFLRRIVGVGTLGYSLEKIMNVLDIPKSGNIRALKKYEERKDKEIYRQRRAQTLKDEE
jgi:hypothetical protein